MNEHQTYTPKQIRNSNPADEFSEDFSNREALVKKYIPTIRFHAGDLFKRVPKTSGIEYDDLVGSGVIGLLSCVDKFDPLNGNTFKTYAGFRIRGEIIDFLRASDWKSRTTRSNDNDISAAISSASKRLNRHLEEQDIADELGITLQDYYNRLSMKSSSTIISYEDLEANHCVDGDFDSMSFLDTVKDDRDSGFDHNIEMEELIRDLALGMEALPKKEFVILSLYYIEELSLKEIGLILGVTESRASQLLKKLVLTLRAFMKDLGYEGID